MQWLASIFFTVFMTVWMLFFGMAYCIITPFQDFRGRFRTAGVMTHVVFFVLKWVCGLRYVVEGRENLPPGNHIAMWKHSSSWETIAQMVVFPAQCWVLKHELMYIPFVGWGLKVLRPIAIDRGAGHAAVSQVVEQGRTRLAEGLWVLIFPEGTRMPAGQTRKYGVSGALLAIETGHKLIPVAHNAGKFWPRRGLVKQPGMIRAVIGPPIETDGLDARAVNARVQEWIEKTVAELMR